MFTRVLIIFVLFTVVGGVLAGTPLHDPNSGMMECCKRAKSKEQSKVAEANRLCCAINCSTTSPLPSGSYNPAPVNFTVTKSIAHQIAALYADHRTAPITPSAYSRESLPRTFQPSYIRYHSFLI